MIMFFMILLQLNIGEERNFSNIIFQKHLEIEQNYSIKVEIEQFQFFEKLIQRFSNYLERSELNIRDKNNLPEILRLIHKSILRESIVIENDTKSNLMSYSIANKSFDCDKLVLIYLSIAECYNIQLNAVYIPGHIFLEWKNNGESNYYETTTGKKIAEIDLIKKFQSVSPAFYNKIKLKRLSRSDMIALIHFNIAMYYLLNNQYRNSFLAFNKAERLHSDISEIHVGKAFVNLAYGNQFSAIHDYSKAIELSPHNFRYYFSRAKLYSSLNQYDLAKNDLDKVIKLNRMYQDAYFQQALIELELRNFSLALEKLEFGLAIKENELFEDLKNLCRSYLKNDYLGMTEILESVINENPNFILGYYLLAENFSRLNRFIASNYYYDKLINLNQNDARPHYSKALNYEKLDKKNLALQALEHAIKINPNYKQAILLKKNLSRPLETKK